MAPNREKVWVGLFVVIAAGVLTATTLAVWGGVGRSGVPHYAYFKFSGGVQRGTAVRLGGMRVGAVQRVRIDDADSTRIRIDLVVDPDTPLKTDSVARLSSLGPLSDSYIEISTGTASAALLPPGSVLDSVESVGLTQLGDTIQSLVPQVRDTIEKLSLTLDGLQTTVGRVNDLLSDSNRANVNVALTRVNDLLNDRNRANLGESLRGFNELLIDARPRVSTGLATINDAASRLAPLIEDMRQTSASADQLLLNLNAELLEDRPDLRASLSQLREVLTRSAGVMSQLQALVNQNTGNIEEILENMRQSADNIRSLTETLKSSPASLIRGVNLKDRKPGGPRQ